MTVTRPIAVMMLVLCTMLWGFAFIAQKTAMDSMGPLTFAASRCLLGGLLILPISLWEYRRRTVQLTRKHWLLIGFLSVAFFFGSWLQQAGLRTTTVTNGGFLTGLYVLLVPAIALVVLRTRPHPIVAISVPLALLGIFLLNGGRLDRFNPGDIMVIVSALFWAMHMLTLGYLARATGLPIFISGISFVFTGVLALGIALAIENPSWAGLAGGWKEILYVGVVSTALAFSLQAIGQQHVPPSNAAVILSAESLFAALGGALLLGERLPPVGYAGAALIFLAIVLVETVPAWVGQRKRRREAQAATP